LFADGENAENDLAGKLPQFLAERLLLQAFLQHLRWRMAG
jgi:hypothetical protein